MLGWWRTISKERNILKFVPLLAAASYAAWIWPTCQESYPKFRAKASL